MISWRSKEKQLPEEQRKDSLFLFSSKIEEFQTLIIEEPEVKDKMESWGLHTEWPWKSKT